MVKIISQDEVKSTITLEELINENIAQNYTRARFKVDERWVGFSAFDIVDGKQRRQPTSLKEVVEAYKNKKLYYFESARLVEDVQVDPYCLTDTYVSDRINPGSEANSMLGLNRLLNVEPATEGDGNYVYACANGKWDFYLKSDVGYYFNGEFKGIDKVGEELKDSDLYLSDDFGNAPVSSIVEGTYNLEQAKKDGRNIEDSISSDGKITQYKLTDDGTSFTGATKEKTFKEFNEQAFAMHNNQAKMLTRVYKPAKDGEYLRITLRGQSEPIAVRATGEDSQLYYADKSGNHGEQIRLETEDRAQVLRNIIGHRLYVKIDKGAEEKWAQTEPITAQQAMISYNSPKYMQSTKEHDNYMADNAYLRLSNGQYVKESEFVRPIAYNFVFDEKEEYDAYLCYVTNAEGNTETIIAPKDFKGGRINGYNVNLADMYRIKKSSNSLKDCSVIQTTNNGEKINKCVTLSERPTKKDGAITAEKKEKSSELLQNALEQFKSEYKQGRYLIDGNKVLVKQDDGTYKEMDLDCAGELPRRFIYSDEIYSDDVTHSDSKYKYLLNNPEYVNEATGKLKGSPKFNTKGAIKDFYKKFGKLGAESVAAFVMGGGFLALLGAPIVVAGAAAAYVATGIFAPLYYLAKGLRLKYKAFPDKVEANRNNVKKNLDNQLQSLYEKIMSRAKDEDTDKKDLKQYFEATLNSDIAANFHSLSETRYLALFEIRNGQADITESNAALYSKFNFEIRKTAKDLAKVKKALLKQPDNEELKAQQQELQAVLYGQINSPKAGVLYKELTERNEYEQKIEALKTYLGVKCFGGTTTDEGLDEAIANKELYKEDGTLNIDGIKDAKVYEKYTLTSKRGEEKVLLKSGEKCYFKDKDGILHPVEEEKGKVIVDKRTVVELDTLQSMFSNDEIKLLDESGHYEKPVVEEIAPVKPEEKKPVKKELTEEQKRKKAEKSAELKKPIEESALQQEDLWKGIIAARQIDLAGENAAKDADFSKKLKFITSKKYAALLEKAAKSAPLEIMVRGKKQTIDIGLLSNTSEKITRIQNLVEKLKGTTK